MILRVLGPKLASLTVVKPLVESIVLVCDIERRMSSVEGEQDYTDCKKIDFRASVWATFKYLRCHVVLCTNGALHDASTLITRNWLCKAQVDDLHIVIGVEKDVGAFQVTMHQTF